MEKDSIIWARIGRQYLLESDDKFRPYVAIFTETCAALLSTSERLCKLPDPSQVYPCLLLSYCQNIAVWPVVCLAARFLKTICTVRDKGVTYKHSSACAFCRAEDLPRSPALFHVRAPPRRAGQTMQNTVLMTAKTQPCTCKHGRATRPLMKLAVSPVPCRHDTPRDARRSRQHGKLTRRMLV